MRAKQFGDEGKIDAIGVALVQLAGEFFALGYSMHRSKNPDEDYRKRFEELREEMRELRIEVDVLLWEGRD